MCVIAVCIDKKPTFDQVKRMHEDNSHGCSISWFNEKGLAQYRKGLDEKELFKLTYELPLPYALHFRQSSFTKDKENKLLNHPFEIVEGSPLRLEGESVKLLIHNGTIREYELMLAAANVLPKADEPMTDTRAIAMIMARNNERLPWRIPGYFVIVDSVRKQFRLSGNFTNEDGILFSNLTWKWGKYNYQSHWHKDYSDEDIYKYLTGEEIPVSNETDNSHQNTESIQGDAQKKNESPNEETAEKAIKKTKALGKKNRKNGSFQIIKINNLMTPLQYNSGIYYRADAPHGNQEFMKEGMKERRRWWKGVYTETLYWQQKNVQNKITEYKCVDCDVHLPFFRTNTLHILGFKSNEYRCASCERLVRNSQSREEAGIADNFDSKTTRLLTLPKVNFGCCI